MRLVYFSFLLCMILLCSISCNDLNGVVDCVGDGSDDGSFIHSEFNNVLLVNMQNKI